MQWRVAACIGFLILLAGCTASGQDLTLDDAKLLAGEELQQFGKKLASSSSPSATPTDPNILAVRPILTGLKIGYFDKDTNTQKYYTVTGTDITRASLVTADKSYWVTIRGIWRVRVKPDSSPDVTWDASGTKVLSTQLLDSTCCSSKALAAS